VQHETILKHLRDLHNLQLQHHVHQQVEDKQNEEKSNMHLKQQAELEEAHARRLTQLKQHIDQIHVLVEQQHKEHKELQANHVKERDQMKVRQQDQLKEVLKEKVKNRAQQEHMQRQLEVEQLKRLQKERLNLHEKEVSLEKMRLMQQGLINANNGNGPGGAATEQQDITC
jgi:hypothetical protein